MGAPVEERLGERDVCVHAVARDGVLHADHVVGEVLHEGLDARWGHLERWAHGEVSESCN